MCPSSNNSREFVTELLGVHRTATNHCRNVGPDLGDIWDGEEIGAALSRGRERPRYYDYPTSYIINISRPRAAPVVPCFDAASANVRYCHIADIGSRR